MALFVESDMAPGCGEDEVLWLVKGPAESQGLVVFAPDTPNATTEVPSTAFDRVTPIASPLGNAVVVVAHHTSMSSQDVPHSPAPEPEIELRFAKVRPLA